MQASHDVCVLAALRSVTIPSINSHTSRKDKKAFKQTVANAFASQGPVLTEISFRITELERCHTILTMYINLVSRKILKKSEAQVQAEALANKLKTVIVLQQSMRQDVILFVNERFNNIIRDHLQYWETAGDIEEAIARLKIYVQKPEIFGVAHEDIAVFIDNVSRMQADPDGMQAWRRIQEIYPHTGQSLGAKSSPRSIFDEKCEHIISQLKGILKEWMEHDVSQFVDECFNTIIKERVANWKECGTEKALALLKSHVKHPETYDVYLKDIIAFINAVSNMANPGEIPSWKLIQEIYGAESPIGALSEKCELIISNLKEIKIEAEVVERGRLIDIFGSKIAANIPRDLELSSINVDSPCYIGPEHKRLAESVFEQKLPQVNFQTVSQVEKRKCAAYSYAGADVGKGEFNGDGFLVQKLSKDGAFFTSVVDAAKSTEQSARAARAVLEKLAEETKKYLASGCRLQKLISHLLCEGHIAALNAGIPCTIAFNFVFPNLLEQGVHTCFGGAIGDPRIFFIQPGQHIIECNAISHTKLRSSTVGALGEMLKKSSPMQCDFWHIDAPPGTLVVLASDGAVLDAKDLHLSPRDVCEEMGIELENHKLGQLYTEFTNHRLAKIYEGIEAEEITPAHVAHALISDCVKQSKELMEDVQREKALVQKFKANTLRAKNVQREEEVLQKFRANTLRAKDVEKEKEKPEENDLGETDVPSTFRKRKPGVVDDMTVVVYKLPKIIP